MAKVDSPITFTQWAGKDGRPTPYFYQLILDLWKRTGGFSDAIQDSDTDVAASIGSVVDLAGRVAALESQEPAQGLGLEARIEALEALTEPRPMEYLSRLDEIEAQLIQAEARVVEDDIDDDVLGQIASLRWEIENMVKDFGLEVQRGNISLVSGVNKFGRTTNADNGVATDIHDGADTAGGANVIWDAPNAARTHQIVSSSLNDDGNPAGTGAQIVTIYGLQTWGSAETSEAITMDGTSNVATSNSYVIIHRMVVTAHGSAGPNVGIIKATADTDATITAQILAGAGQTQMAIYGVPSTQTFYMTRLYASLLSSTPASATADITLLSNVEPDNFYDAYITKHTMSLDTDSTGNFEQAFSPPKAFAGPCIIKVQVNASSDNSDVSGGFDGYLVTN